MSRRQFTRRRFLATTAAASAVAIGAPYVRTSRALGRSEGHWLGVPAVTGTQVKPPCARIDLLKSQCGIDVQAMYPAGRPPTREAEHWTWDNFVVAAEKAFKAGNPFGLGLGQTTDS